MRNHDNKYQQLSKSTCSDLVPTCFYTMLSNAWVVKYSQAATGTEVHPNARPRTSEFSEQTAALHSNYSQTDHNP